MNRLVIAVMLASAWMLAGCANKYYYQEGKTIEECQQCYKQCAAKFRKLEDPNAPEELGRFNISYNYEGKFMDACMLEKGYDVVSENRLPLDIKRETFDQWERSKRGLAGTLVEK